MSFSLRFRIKLHWAITGKTAAEIIYDSADAKKNLYGIDQLETSPEGKILKSDVFDCKKLP